jgi:membrane protease YdiL (CAAX protease family)
MVNRISSGRLDLREEVRLSASWVEQRETASRSPDGPRTSALLLAVAWLVVTVVGGLVLQALAPSWSGTVRALAVSVVLAVGVAVLLTCLRWWGLAGFNGPRHWHDLRLLVLPAVLLVVPVATGFKAVTSGLLAMILVGEALTGFMEEAYFRGIILRILRSTGALPAVLLSSALFGAVHLGNAFFRDSAALADPALHLGGLTIGGAPAMAASVVLGLLLLAAMPAPTRLLAALDAALIRRLLR